MSTKAERAQQEKERQESIAYLRDFLPPGTEVYTAMFHVSASGMLRHIGVFVPIEDKGKLYIKDLTYQVALATGYKSTDSGWLRVGGCGMNMGFSVVYNLSRTLYKDNFYCTGDTCRSNDHANGDKNRRKNHKHSDGGYALSQRWL